MRYNIIKTFIVEPNILATLVNNYFAYSPIPNTNQKFINTFIIFNINDIYQELSNMIEYNHNIGINVIEITSSNVNGEGMIFIVNTMNNDYMLRLDRDIRLISNFYHYNIDTHKYIFN